MHRWDMHGGGYFMLNSRSFGSMEPVTTKQALRNVAIFVIIMALLTGLGVLAMRMF